MQSTNVVFLVGGQGSRLASVIDERPKPMAEIQGRPFLDILIEYVASYGPRRFILCAGHFAGYIQKYYEAREFPYELITSLEDQPLDTAGALKNAEHLIHSETFIAINGDSFCPLDYHDFMAFHLSKKALLSLAVVVAQGSKDYGLLTLNESHLVTSFAEKKRTDRKAYISAGVYIFQKSLLNNIPQGISYSLEKELFPSLVGGKTFGYIANCDMIDIGTPARYEYAKKYFSK